MRTLCVSVVIAILLQILDAQPFNRRRPPPPRRPQFQFPQWRPPQSGSGRSPMGSMGNPGRRPNIRNNNNNQRPTMQGQNNGQGFNFNNEPVNFGNQELGPQTSRNANPGGLAVSFDRRGELPGGFRQNNNIADTARSPFFQAQWNSNPTSWQNNFQRNALSGSNMQSSRNGNRFQIYNRERNNINESPRRTPQFNNQRSSINDAHLLDDINRNDNFQLSNFWTNIYNSRDSANRQRSGISLEEQPVTMREFQNAPIIVRLPEESTIISQTSQDSSPGLLPSSDNVQPLDIRNSHDSSIKRMPQVSFLTINHASGTPSLQKEQPVQRYETDTGVNRIQQRTTMKEKLSFSTPSTIVVTPQQPATPKTLFNEIANELQPNDTPFKINVKPRNNVPMISMISGMPLFHKLHVEENVVKGQFKPFDITSHTDVFNDKHGESDISIAPSIINRVNRQPPVGFLGPFSPITHDSRQASNVIMVMNEDNNKPESAVKTHDESFAPGIHGSKIETTLKDVAISKHTSDNAKTVETTDQITLPKYQQFDDKLTINQLTSFNPELKTNYSVQHKPEEIRISTNQRPHTIEEVEAKPSVHGNGIIVQSKKDYPFSSGRFDSNVVLPSIQIEHEVPKASEFFQSWGELGAHETDIFRPLGTFGAGMFGYRKTGYEPPAFDSLQLQSGSKQDVTSDVLQTESLLSGNQKEEYKFREQLKHHFQQQQQQQQQYNQFLQPRSGMFGYRKTGYEPSQLQQQQQQQQQQQHYNQFQRPMSGMFGYRKTGYEPPRLKSIQLESGGKQGGTPDSKQTESLQASYQKQGIQFQHQLHNQFQRPVIGGYPTDAEKPNLRETTLNRHAFSSGPTTTDSSINKNDVHMVQSNANIGQMEVLTNDQPNAFKQHNINIHTSNVISNKLDHGNMHIKPTNINMPDVQYNFHNGKFEQDFGRFGMHSSATLPHPFELRQAHTATGSNVFATPEQITHTGTNPSLYRPSYRLGINDVKAYDQNQEVGFHGSIKPEQPAIPIEKVILSTSSSSRTPENTHLASGRLPIHQFDLKANIDNTNPNSQFTPFSLTSSDFIHVAKNNQIGEVNGSIRPNVDDRPILQATYMSTDHSLPNQASEQKEINSVVDKILSLMLNNGAVTNEHPVNIQAEAVDQSVPMTENQSPFHSIFAHDAGNPFSYGLIGTPLFNDHATSLITNPDPVPLNVQEHEAIVKPEQSPITNGQDQINEQELSYLTGNIWSTENHNKDNSINTNSLTPLVPQNTQHDINSLFGAHGLFDEKTSLQGSADINNHNNFALNNQNILRTEHSATSLIDKHLDYVSKLTQSEFPSPTQTHSEHGYSQNSETPITTQVTQPLGSQKSETSVQPEISYLLKPQLGLNGIYQPSNDAHLNVHNLIQPEIPTIFQPIDLLPKMPSDVLNGISSASSQQMPSNQTSVQFISALIDSMSALDLAEVIRTMNLNLPENTNINGPVVSTQIFDDPTHSESLMAAQETVNAATAISNSNIPLPENVKTTHSDGTVPLIKIGNIHVNSVQAASGINTHTTGEVYKQVPAITVPFLSEIDFGIAVNNELNQQLNMDTKTAVAVPTNGQVAESVPHDTFSLLDDLLAGLRDIMLPETTALPATTTPEPPTTTPVCTPASLNFKCTGKGMFTSVGTMETWCVSMCQTTGCVDNVCECGCQKASQIEANPQKWLNKRVSIANGKITNNQQPVSQNGNKQQQKKQPMNKKRANQQKNKQNQQQWKKQQNKKNIKPKWQRPKQIPTTPEPIPTTPEPTPEPEEEEEVEWEDRITTTTTEMPTTTEDFIWELGATISPFKDIQLLQVEQQDVRAERLHVDKMPQLAWASEIKSRFAKMAKTALKTKEHSAWKEENPANTEAPYPTTTWYMTTPMPSTAPPTRERNRGWQAPHPVERRPGTWDSRPADRWHEPPQRPRDPPRDPWNDHRSRPTTPAYDSWGGNRNTYDPWQGGNSRPNSGWGRRNDNLRNSWGQNTNRPTTEEPDR